MKKGSRHIVAVMLPASFFSMSCSRLSDQHAQYRECRSLHCEADAKDTRTYNPKNDQRPFQAGNHRLPLEYLAEYHPNEAYQRNAHYQDTCNIHHNSR